MGSVFESGHARNVANFNQLIAFAQGYGAAYNPSKAALQLPQLQALAAAAAASLTGVTTQDTAFNAAVNARVVAYEAVAPLATRLMAALQSTNATQQTVDDARGFTRKLRGTRSKAAKPVAPDAEAPKTISASQLSYDQRLQHFEGLRALLTAEPGYAPNEADLKPGALLALTQSLTQHNAAVATAHVAVSNARLARNQKLYAEGTGLVDLAGEVKHYIKSVFGGKSAEYAQVSGLKFRRVRVGN